MIETVAVKKDGIAAEKRIIDGVIVYRERIEVIAPIFPRVISLILPYMESPELNKVTTPPKTPGK